MIRVPGHPSLRQLSKYVDAELSAEQAERIAKHVYRCSRCGDVLERMHRVDGAAKAALTDSVATGLLEQILRQREAGVEVVLPLTDPEPAREPWRRIGVRAAAGVAVLLLGSGIAFATGRFSIAAINPTASTFDRGLPASSQEIELSETSSSLTALQAPSPARDGPPATAPLVDRNTPCVDTTSAAVAARRSAVTGGNVGPDGVPTLRVVDGFPIGRACGVKPAIYAIIDGVTQSLVGYRDPSIPGWESINLSGTFIVPRPMSSGEHLPPQKGFISFLLDPAREEALRREWNALRAAVRTGEVVGFGQYWVANSDPNLPSGVVNKSFEVRVYEFGDVGPQPYPRSHERGVITVFDGPDDLNPRFGPSSAELVRRLKAAVSGETAGTAANVQGYQTVRRRDAVP